MQPTFKVYKTYKAYKINSAVKVSKARPAFFTIMLASMIGLYSALVQAQGQAPVGAIADRQSERARQQAAEQVLSRGDRAPVVEARPVFERRALTDNTDETLAAAFNDTKALPGRLPKQLPIVNSNGNRVFTEIEIAPDIRVVQREWIMLLPVARRNALENQAPDLMEFLTGSQPFDSIGSEILIFSVPTELDSDDAILELVPADMRHLFDRNHIYSVEADDSSEPEPDEATKVPLSPLHNLESSFRPICEDPVGIGIIDSAIFVEHPAFADMAQRGTRIISQDFIDPSLEPPSGHGTAVAGLLTAKNEQLNPLLPGATLYSAGVVYSRDIFHEGATVSNLLRALNWLMTQDVQVINMSLAGPPNRLLAQGIEAAIKSGRFVVAAVGNEGPHAPAQFPAAYDFVISATAVDEQGNIYRWANQGDHMDFAARGVSITTTRGDGTIGKESGTSMAAPVISAFLACALIRQRNAPAAFSELKSRAIDLGEPGYDTVFGHGLLHPQDGATQEEPSLENADLSHLDQGVLN